MQNKKKLISRNILVNYRMPKMKNSSKSTEEKTKVFMKNNKSIN